MSLTNAPPRPERPKFKVNWLFWGTVFLLVSVSSGGMFIYQTIAQRNELKVLIDDLSRMDRAELTDRWIIRNRGMFYRKKEWAQKVDWTPAPAGEKPTDPRARGLEEIPPLPRITTVEQAPLALAATPRVNHLDFPAIYLLYDGEQVVASFSLSAVGGFFNGQMLDQRSNPRTLVEKPLNADEQHRLRQLITMLEQRRDVYDPQADQYGWTQNVIRNAQHLLEGSSSGESAPAKPASE